MIVAVSKAGEDLFGSPSAFFNYLDFVFRLAEAYSHFLQPGENEGFRHGC